MPLPALVGLLLFWQGAASNLDVLVVDGSNRPVAGVRVALKDGGKIVAAVDTAEDGHAQFGDLAAARYDLDALKDGFEPLHKAAVAASARVELTLVPLTRKESIEVQGTSAPLEAGASTPNEIPAQTAKELPGRPATVTDALPLLPGVVRVPGGG